MSLCWKCTHISTFDHLYNFSCFFLFSFCSYNVNKLHQKCIVQWNRFLVFIDSESRRILRWINISQLFICSVKRCQCQWTIHTQITSHEMRHQLWQMNRWSLLLFAIDLVYLSNRCKKFLLLYFLSKFVPQCDRFSHEIQLKMAIWM